MAFLMIFIFMLFGLYFLLVTLYYPLDLIWEDVKRIFCRVSIFLQRILSINCFLFIKIKAD